VGEGQVVHLHSEKAREARKGVLEMLLINHPLDCPICDQSGECELQDYTFAEGRKESRLHDPKRFNPAEDFGGDVMYVTNRCILCTRCVRFMDSVAEEPVLNVSERGDRAVIGIFPDHGLTHPWAANVVDLCPVGALLSKDFLNKARAWELDRSASVCPNCTQGCNVMLETRDNTVVRMRARSNEAVNKYFLCACGRLQRHFIHGDNFREPFLERHHQLEGALRQMRRYQRMQRGEPGQTCGPLVDLGVVLHRARAKWKELSVDGKIPLTEPHEMAHDFGLTHFRQSRMRGAHQRAQRAL
jgi:NADH-quinone oxidoreductase subunit G